MSNLELKTIPATPEFNNSAGRLLVLLQSLKGRGSYYDEVATLYGENAQAKNDFKAKAYLAYMTLIGDAFEAFIDDIDTSDKIPDGSRIVIKDGLANLVGRAYPISPMNAPPAIPDAEIALLRMAGSMLDAEPDLDESDAESIRKSIDELRALLESSDLSKSARIALLEIVRLSRNAIDHYTMHGARGFKDAFKKMLADLMEVYLQDGKKVTNETWWSSAIAHVKKVDAVAARLLKYKPLLESAGKLFLSDGDVETPEM